MVGGKDCDLTMVQSVKNITRQTNQSKSGFVT